MKLLLICCLAFVLVGVVVASFDEEFDDNAESRVNVFKIVNEVRRDGDMNELIYDMNLEIKLNMEVSMCPSENELKSFKGYVMKLACSHREDLLDFFLTPSATKIAIAKKQCRHDCSVLALEVSQ